MIAMRIAVSPVSHARVDAEGLLLSADPAILGLNGRAGGALRQSLAVPSIAMLARLAVRLQVAVQRRVSIADGEQDLELWVRAQPDGHLAISGWSETPAWRAAPNPVPPVVPAGAWGWETDASLRLTYIAPGAGIAGGGEAFTMLGRPLTSLFGFDEGPDGVMPIMDALARRRPLRAQPAKLHPGGAALMLSAEVRVDQMGGFAGLSGIAEPVAMAASPVEGLSDGFTTGLDRALRRPLARIVANADSIQAEADGPIARDYSDYAADIATAGRHLLDLVDDLVDLQAIERPDFAPEIEPIDLADVARRAAGLLAVRADHAGVILDRPDQDEHAAGLGDFRRCLQIVVNLIGNAIRYSPQGERVFVTAMIINDRACVTVADHGKGIAEKDQARIFEKFERIDPSEPGGNGLGLFIARRLARAMGGDLTVTSTPGEGALFTLALPIG